MKQDVIKEIEIPEGISVEIKEDTIIVKGQKGELHKTFQHQNILVEKKDNKIIISAKKATKREKKNIGTITAHIKNMLNGAEKGFEYTLQICSVHFPMSVKFNAETREFVIKNFLGEVKERKAKILDNVDVSVDSNIVRVVSADIEKAGQSALNIEKATKIRRKDRRVFQDGIFITHKPGED